MTKLATASCLRKIHGAARQSIAETFRAAKQSHDTATQAERKADKCANAVLEVH